MATHMIKVMYEGTVSKALKNAEAGPTTGGVEVFEVRDVPANLTADDVVEAIRRVGGKPPHRNHEVRWADLSH
jgi:hypothetical protein